LEIWLVVRGGRKAVTGLRMEAKTSLVRSIMRIGCC